MRSDMGFCDSDAVGCDRDKLRTPGTCVHANRGILVQPYVLNPVRTNRGASNLPVVPVGRGAIASVIPELTPRGEQDAERGVIAFALLAPVRDVLFFFA